MVVVAGVEVVVVSPALAVLAGVAEVLVGSLVAGVAVPELPHAPAASAATSGSAIQWDLDTPT